MFEFHGWSIIRYDSHGTNSIKQAKCWEEIHDWINAKYKPWIEMRLITLNTYNDQNCIAINGLHNHYDDWPVEIFKHISEYAPGSYGLLYYNDDESKEFPNQFQVYRLAKSKLTYFEDSFLSPYIPIVEDEFDRNKED